MRPYFAIIKDSFREAMASRVLWVLLGLISIVLVALAPLTYREVTTVGIQSKEIEGWPGSTRGARSWADLPARAIKYVRRIEELIRCPVALVSTSPERDDTILVRDPFAS